MAQRSKTGGNRRRSLYLHDAAGLSFFSYFCIGRRTAEEKSPQGNGGGGGAINGQAE